MADSKKDISALHRRIAEHFEPKRVGPRWLKIDSVHLEAHLDRPDDGSVTWYPNYSDPRNWARLLVLLGLGMLIENNKYVLLSGTVSTLKWKSDPGSAVVACAEAMLPKEGSGDG